MISDSISDNIPRITSSNEYFEYDYPFSNALLHLFTIKKSLFCLESELYK